MGHNIKTYNREFDKYFNEARSHGRFSTSACALQESSLLLRGPLIATSKLNADNSWRLMVILVQVLILTCTISYLNLLRTVYSVLVCTTCFDNLCHQFDLLSSLCIHHSDKILVLVCLPDCSHVSKRSPLYVLKALLQAMPIGRPNPEATSQVNTIFVFFSIATHP